jgi:hypothetical protein
MKAVGLNLTVEGDISDCLGVQIDRINENTFNLSQPHLINDVLKELRLDGQNVAIKKTTVASSRTLCRHLDSQPFDEHFNYPQVIGQLNYLEKCSRLDISCAVHQAARFVSNPRIQHGKALKWLGRYPVGSRDKGMIYSPSNQSFDVYVDASFTGDWDPTNAVWDTDTARSRTGYAILYASCPVIWASKLQTEIALSTTEAEYLQFPRRLVKCFHLWNSFEKCKSRDVDCEQQHRIFIVVSSKTTAVPSNWLTVSRTPRCAQELGISAQSIITFATRFKMKTFPFIQSQQLTCLLTYSPRFAMRRSTQG